METSEELAIIVDELKRIVQELQNELYRIKNPPLTEFLH